MQKIEKFLSKNTFLVILVLAIPAVWALFVKSYFGASDDIHIAWLYEMGRSISMGQFPPRFVPDLSFGFGYPLFNFVFPLPFLLGYIFHLLGLSLVDSIKAVLFISVPLSGYFTFKFLRKHTSYWLSLAGAVVYMFTPYRATDMYVRGAIGEVFAFAMVPLVAWGISASNVLLITLGTAGLILSHNIMAYMFMPFLFVLAIILGLNKKVITGFVLGVLTSIYFWLPAIVESKLVKYDTVFNFFDHFPTLKQLITPYFGYGASVPGPYDGMSFFVGFVNILLVIAAIYYYKKLNKVAWWALATFTVGVFMMNFRSTFIWESIPLIKYFQFPWRFLSLTTFGSAVLVLVFDKLKYSKIVSWIIILLAIGLNFSYFRPQDFLGRSDDYYLNRYIPIPIASEEYKMTGEEYLRLPKDTEVRPDSLSVDINLTKSFETDNAEDTTYDFYKYNFPGWVVKIDGKDVDTNAGKPYGQVEFTIPKGSHKVEIKFTETRLKKILDAVSLLALIVAVTIEVRKKKK